MATLDEQLRSQNQEEANAINDYVNELKATAQGNYEFIVKFLKQQHNLALGTDDTARAKFFETVANKLEEQIGRIPYDFETKTAREKQDISNYLTRSALQRQTIAEQGKEFAGQQEFKTKEEQQATAESANTRGLLGSGIQQKEINRLALARKLFEQDPFYSNQARQTAALNQQDIEAKQQSTRNIEDITTGARRAGQDENLTFSKGTEGAALDLKNAQRTADIAGNQARRQAITLLAQQKAAEEAANAYKSYGY